MRWIPRSTSDTYFDPGIDSIRLTTEVEAIPSDKGEEVVLKDLEYEIECSFDAEPVGDEDYDDHVIENYFGYFSGLLSIKAERDANGQYTTYLSFQSGGLGESSSSENTAAPIGLFRFHPEEVSGVSFDIEEEISESEDNVTKVAAADYNLEWAIDRAENHTTQLLRNIVYLGPLRDEPRRSYGWTGVTPATVGNRGEQAVQVLLADKSTSLDAVSSWLRRLGLAGSISLKQVGKGARIWEPLITLQDGRTQVNLADVGFGVSQVLPVIVALLSAPRGSLVLLEHPDIHLHPRAQAELADLLIEVASAGEIQILVESHSEHLLARIQRRVAESGRGDGGLAPEDVRLYFCKQEQGKSELEPLKVQPSGVITNWPDDFFGDILEERMALGGFYPEADGPA